MKALAESFGMEKLGRSMANYDPMELERLNQKLLHQLPFSEVQPLLAARGMDAIDANFWEQIKPNLTTIDDAKDWWNVLFQPITPVIEDKAFADAAAASIPSGEWGNDSWDLLVNAVKEKTGRKGKELFMPLRLALTGMEHGPEMKTVFALLGRDRAEKRLKGEAA
jgi:glutamyl-tRNA synthetase